MKILRIIARLNVGGPARHVVWLTKGLQDTEFQSVLVAGTVPQGEADMSYFAAQNGVEPVYIPELSRELSLNDIFALRKFYKLIKREKPDVIHTHTAKAGTVGRLAAFAYRWLTWSSLIGRPRRVKIVHTFHGHVFHSYYGHFKTQIFLIIEKFLARFATNKIIVISSQQLEEIHGQFGIGPRGQFIVVPLGIDLDSFSDADRNRLVLREEIGATDSEIVVGFLGRLTEIKNVPLFLAVAAMYVAKENLAKGGIKFVIIGEGHLREPLEAEAESLGIGEIVSFLGHRPNVSDLIAGMDIVALTSLNEGTPLSLIEAMADGTPVISTAVGGVVDLLGQTVEEHTGFRVCERGVAVDPGSAENFYDGLIYLAKDEKLRKRLAETGRQFITAEYSKDRLMVDIKTLYRDLTES